LSQLNFWVDRGKFAAGVVDLHLPVNAAMSVTQLLGRDVPRACGVGGSQKVDPLVSARRKCRPRRTFQKTRPHQSVIERPSEMLQSFTRLFFTFWRTYERQGLAHL
jgi:hypothetical protein